MTSGLATMGGKAMDSRAVRRTSRWRLPAVFSLGLLLLAPLLAAGGATAP
jgi:hypothetical protein